MPIAEWQARSMHPLTAVSPPIDPNAPPPLPDPTSPQPFPEPLPPPIPTPPIPPTPAPNPNPEVPPPPSGLGPADPCGGESCTGKEHHGGDADDAADLPGGIDRAGCKAGALAVRCHPLA
jgi:hypothetical protein